MWKYGLTDLTHCEFLLKLANFKQDAHVLDIGCGIGAVAQYMKAIRPDLQFSLQNISKAQLDCCPPEFPQYLGNMIMLENVPDASFDAAMVCYALGHVEDLPVFFSNVARVLKPNGTLFVYDLLPLPGEEKWAKEKLGYETYPKTALQKATNQFTLTHDYALPELNLYEFQRVCGTEITAEVRMFTKPVAYKFKKALTSK